MSPLATYLVETFVTLVAVVAVAIIVLVGARRLGVGRPHGPMRLIGRMPLDARRVLYLVQVSDQVLILGASEAGLAKLGELPKEALHTIDLKVSSPGFPEMLLQLRNRLPHKSTSAKGNARNNPPARELEKGSTDG